MPVIGEGTVLVLELPGVDRASLEYLYNLDPGIIGVHI